MLGIKLDFYLFLSRDYLVPNVGVSFIDLSVKGYTSPIDLLFFLGDIALVSGSICHSSSTLWQEGSMSLLLPPTSYCELISESVVPST